MSRRAPNMVPCRRSVVSGMLHPHGCLYAIMRPNVSREEPCNRRSTTGQLVPCPAGAGRARRIVAVPGAGYELAAAVRRNHLHLDGAEAAVALGVGWVVGEYVLVADVVGN